MMQSLKFVVSGAFVIGLIVGCTQGHCRRKVDTTGQNIVDVSAETVTQSPTSSDKKDRVFVYKYDGSLQCQKAKGIALDAMAKELQGIEIFSSVKKSDGLMHIQVCGSITGMANVYEIPEQSLKAAERKGFKKWSFE